MFALSRELGYRHPRYLIQDLTTDELLDWLALYEIDPWGETRRDYRAAVASMWVRGAKFEDVRPTYPHVGCVDADDDDLIALLDADRLEAERLDAGRAAAAEKEKAQTDGTA